jgi:membrane-bound serine protease (ClpP class)
MCTWGGQLRGFLPGLMAVVGLLSGAGYAAAPATSGASTPSANSTLSSDAKPAVVITLQGVIDDYSRDGLFKRFAEARKLGAKVVILKLNTPGGLVTAGLDISRFLKQQDDLHVVAFVHEKAYSAGIMIGLACDELVMEPGSYIGDSAPIVMDPAGGLQTLGKAERAKAESPILADFRDSAVKNGYDPLLAEAMVSYGKVVRWVEYAPGSDLKSEISDSESKSSRNTARPGDRRFVDDAELATLTKDGWQEVREPGVPSPIDSADTLLTVSADVAKRIGLSKATVSDPQAFAAQRGYTIVGELAPGAGEQFVEFLGSTGVRIVLLIVFLMSLYVALHTPGAGGAEAVAMISLGALVGIPLLTGYAQWWEIAAILVGLVLLALEIFVIPGFGVAGVAGIVLVLGGMVLTFVGNTPGLPDVWRLPQVWAGVQNGLLAVVVSFAVSGLLAIWVRKYLPKLPYLNRLVLQGPTPATAGVPVDGPPVTSETWPFIGTVGRAVSDLKPGGSAEFPYGDDRRATAVVSDSGYVTAGTKLVVREVQGNRVVVRPVMM